MIMRIKLYLCTFVKEMRASQKLEYGSMDVEISDNTRKRFNAYETHTGKTFSISSSWLPTTTIR